MRKLLTYAIPVILGVGVLAALVSNPSEEGQFSASRQQGGVSEEQPFGLPAVIEEPTTTTTTAPALIQPVTPVTIAPTPTTAARPVSTKPAPKPAATPRPAPQPVQTPGPAPPDCGTGSAQAKATLVDTDPGIATRYRLGATVTNNSTKAVELDRLVVQAAYGGVTKTFSASVGGRRIEPGATISIDIPESDSATAPSSFSITEFAFHTAGLPACASS
jgi:cytoskeletal protein RodZ